MSSNSEVGNTLNSTGREMYIETISTITDSVMLALISTSSRNDGMGAIIAITMPSTASGTLSSLQFPNRDGALVCGWTIFACAFGAIPRALADPGAETVGAEMGAI